MKFVESFQFLGEEIWGVENAGWDGWEIAATLRRLHLMHRDVSLRESRRLTPLPRPNIPGMDIPDASASLRNSLPALPGYRQFVGNSAWCACVKLHFSPDLF